ncbi:uncharacterized protein LOC129743926 [Uranotaenia lowii]|uniref:uncharacterized protein LOC129743926 n=1 Tax=Uranotaenia lowii TaxID=190385 RepID=UPI00247AF398|nr:uncharacterized protein LOC129743926 [Uranotaenia lowii]
MTEKTGAMFSFAEVFVLFVILRWTKFLKNHLNCLTYKLRELGYLGSEAAAVPPQTKIRRFATQRNYNSCRYVFRMFRNSLRLLHQEVPNIHQEKLAPKSQHSRKLNHRPPAEH